MKSKVKWFNNDKGYGFIEYKINEDAFVHFTTIDQDRRYKILLPGDIVEYDIVKTEKGYRAINVKRIEK